MSIRMLPLLLLLLPALSLQQQASEQPCGKPAIVPDETQPTPGGKEAVPHSWPWLVSIRFSDSHACGGSIYSENWIVTAARCVEDYQTGPLEYSVDAGRHCRDCIEPTLQHRQVTKFVLHPGYTYNSSTGENDLAMLRVDQPFVFGSAVSPVCLPKSPVSDSASCLAAGWGNFHAGDGNGTELVHQVTLPIVPNSICGDESHFANITEGMLCAGFEQGGIDSCQNDFGGPLVCKSDGVWHMHGVAFGGEGCDKPQRPPVYTRVQRYADWIKETAAA